MTEHEQISALKVQRDSAIRGQKKAEVANRALLRHQAEVREWLKEAITKWEAAEEADRHRTASQIHQRAIELLRDAEGLLGIE